MHCSDVLLSLKSLGMYLTPLDIVLYKQCSSLAITALSVCIFTECRWIALVIEWENSDLQRERVVCFDCRKSEMVDNKHRARSLYTQGALLIHAGRAPYTRRARGFIGTFYCIKVYWNIILYKQNTYLIYITKLVKNWLVILNYTISLCGWNIRQWITIIKHIYFPKDVKYVITNIQYALRNSYPK